MKNLVSENNDYKIYLEIGDLCEYTNKRELRFTSQWLGAKNPKEYQKKFCLYLTDQELKEFKNIL
jgi:hypothetical protein